MSKDRPLVVKPNFAWMRDDWGDEAALESGIANLVRPQMRRKWLTRSALLVGGLIVFELTANAAVSTAVGCLEFGRNDFALAWWLFRANPDRFQGRIDAQCYLAWGFLKVCLIATGVMFVFIAIEEARLHQVPIPVGVKRPAVPPDFIGACLVSMGCLTISSLLGLGAIISAMRLERKLWLGPEPRRAKEQGVWPPTRALPLSTSTNRAGWIVLSGIIPLTIASSGLGVVLMMLLGSNDFLGSAFVIGVTQLVLIYRGIVPSWKERVLAGSPEECWGP